jgi:hypothetical protein
MKRKLAIIAAAGVAVAAIGLGVIAQTDEQGGGVPFKIRVELVELYADRPDTASPNWKPLSPDVGLMVRHDRSGVAQARLYVRTGDDWKAVAVDGFADVAPSDLFLRH